MIFNNLFKEPVTKNVLVLVTLFIIFILTLLFVGYASQWASLTITAELTNQRNRGNIGKAILNKLILIDLNIHKIASSVDTRQILHYERDVLRYTHVLKDALVVLQQGGEFVDVLPVNLGNQDEIQERIVCTPVTRGYDIDVIDLMPKIIEIEDTIHEFVGFIIGLANTSAPDLPKLQREVKFSLMQLETLFLRSREHANRITFETNARISALERQRRASRLFWDNLILTIIAGVLIACTLIFVLILKRIHFILEHRRRDAEALQHAKESIDTILAVLPVGIVIVRPDQTIAMINHAGLDLLEAVDEKAIIGKRYHEIFRLPDSHACSVLKFYKQPHESEVAIKTLCGKQLSVIKKAMSVTLDGEQMILEAFIDISNRIQAEQELKESQQLFETVFESLPAGIVVIDAQTRRIRNINKTAQKMIGETSNNIVGCVCHHYICPADQGQCPILDQGMRVDTSERILLTAQGERIEILKSVEVLTMAGRKVLVESFVDISQLKKVERQLIQAKESADQANEAKSRFLANMSHEVRTPMNGILGLCHLALRDDMPPNQREYLEKILGTGQALLGVLNDILDFSRIEAGKLTLEAVPFDLRETLQRAMDLLELSVESKGLRLSLKMACDIPRIIKGDPLRLGQVIINLTGNAVKFTEQGEILVQVEEAILAEEARKEGWFSLTFTVRDTGIGIPPEKIDTLFDSFEQADGSMTRKYGGAGLGLAISKGLVELMGGTIGASSSPEHPGSMFYFTLPFQKVEQTVVDPMPEFLAAPVRPIQPTHLASSCTQESPPVSMAVGSCKGARCLIVDDIPLNRQILQELIESAGLHPEVAVNGREAVEAVLEKDFDIVFMDVQMPEMDGLQATQIIRGNEGFADLPIIALTAHAMAGDREKCLQAGMNDFLSKPIQPKELFQTLKQWVGSRRSSLEQGAGKGSGASSGPYLDFSIQGLDLETALESMLGKVDLLRTILTIFARENRMISRHMEEALDQHDMGRLRELAHSIKGQAGQIRAGVLLRQSSTMERAALAGDSERCRAMLPDFIAELGRIILAVDALFPQTSPAPSSTVSRQEIAMTDEMRHAMEELAGMLAANDLTAEHVIADLKQRADPNLAPMLEAVSVHIDALEFDQALQDLRNLLESTQ